MPTRDEKGPKNQPATFPASMASENATRDKDCDGKWSKIDLYSTWQLSNNAPITKWPWIDIPSCWPLAGGLVISVAFNRPLYSCTRLGSRSVFYLKIMATFFGFASQKNAHLKREFARALKSVL